MTTLNARVSRLVTPLGAFALLTLGVPLATPSTAFGQEQLLYISATGVTGSPVSDLTAEEIVVQWDGEDTEIVELELIEWPVQVTMMVDNGRGGRDIVVLWSRLVLGIWRHAHPGKAKRETIGRICPRGCGGLPIEATLLEV